MDLHRAVSNLEIANSAAETYDRFDVFKTFLHQAGAINFARITSKRAIELPWGAFASSLLDLIHFSVVVG